MKFRKKSEVVEAVQWFPGKPIDAVERLPQELAAVGNIVRLGWVLTPEGGQLVSPGDWIITDAKGQKNTCKPAIFAQTYEPV